MQIRARFRPHPRGFGFLTPVADDGVTETTFRIADGEGVAEHDSAFVPPPLARGLVADDLVDAEVDSDDKGVAATKVTVVARARSMLVGTVQHGPGGLVLEPDPGLATGWVTLAPSVSDHVATALGRQIVVLAGQDEDGAPLGRALVAGPHVVGSPQAIRAAAVVNGFGRAAPSLIPGGAAAAGLDPVEAATTHGRIVGQLAGGRRGAAAGLPTDGPVPAQGMHVADRTDEPCITIDDPDAQDLDDAIAVAWDGSADAPVQVAVHIADAAAMVGLDSPADRYARVMASTAYFAIGPNAPMLDPALAEDALSLLPGEDRSVLSVRYEVDPDGAIGEVEVEAAAIRSRTRLSYGAVQRWLDGDGGELVAEAGSAAETAEQIVTAGVEAARRLGVDRDARATFEDLFASAAVEPGLVDGRLAVVEAEPHARAYRLIERLMVAANESVAAWLVARDVPALYRAHTGIDADRLARLRAAADLVEAKIPALEEDAPASEDVMADVLAAIDRLDGDGRPADRDLLIAAATAATARAGYDPDPSHHRGLGSHAYVHFTSPIRRYADLVVHRQIRAALGDEAPPHPVETLRPLARWLDGRAAGPGIAGARERNALWARLLDRGYLDGPEEAVVTGVTANGLRIRLPRLGLGSFVPAERALGLPQGERATLEVDQHGLTTGSGPWRAGSHVRVRFVRLDDRDRAVFELDRTNGAGTQT